jgi:hypothetical protein
MTRIQPTRLKRCNYSIDFIIGADFMAGKINIHFFGITGDTLFFYLIIVLY